MTCAELKVVGLAMEDFAKKMRNGFCGDGITEGNEQCDDGFPLKGGDGCTISCKV